MNGVPFGYGSSTVTLTDAAWSRRLFNSLTVGGNWAVPRSGLIFEKSVGPDTMMLTAVMPYDAGMPGTPEGWREYQRDDLALIRQKFASAGITVAGEIE